jgi:hypothetical protein
MTMPAPRNIGVVNLTISVTLRDTAAAQPLTPLFSIVAAAGDPDHAGTPLFQCNGRGDENADLLKEILRKILASYPMKPISLCLNGSEIVATS